MIGIINYGMGNLASVQNAFSYLNISSEICSDPSELNKYDKIILPGVGAFSKAIENLTNTGFTDALQESVLVKKKPMLGICLGMQLLLDSSMEHGFHKGLGFIKGAVKSFNDILLDEFRVPHMGWNNVISKNNSLIFNNNIEKEASTFYFVHSYYCELENIENVVGITDYGIQFHSSIEQDNIFACQFHPEKSQKDGLEIFEKFALI